MGNFLQRLHHFDKDNIEERVVKSIEPLLDDPSLSPPSLIKVSRPVEALMTWVRAMHKYHYTSIAVEPLRQRLALMEQELGDGMRELNTQRERHKNCLDQLAE